MKKNYTIRNTDDFIGVIFSLIRFFIELGVNFVIYVVKLMFLIVVLVYLIITKANLTKSLKKYFAYVRT